MNLGTSGMAGGARFITADVVVRAHTSLAQLAQCVAAGDGLAQIHHGIQGEQVLVLHDVHGHADANALLAHWCRWLANLPPAAQACWQAADSRVFDLGFESGQGKVMQWQVAPERLADMARFALGLQVTIYPMQPGS